MGGWFDGGPFAALANLAPRLYVEISVGTSPVGFAKTSLPEGVASPLLARAARISVENADIRYREEGGAPTSTSGHYRTAGEEFILGSHEAITKFQAIQAGSTGAILRCTLYF